MAPTDRPSTCSSVVLPAVVPATSTPNRMQGVLALLVSSIYIGLIYIVPMYRRCVGTVSQYVQQQVCNRCRCVPGTSVGLKV